MAAARPQRARRAAARPGRAVTAPADGQYRLRQSPRRAWGAPRSSATPPPHRRSAAAAAAVAAALRVGPSGATDANPQQTRERRTHRRLPGLSHSRQILVSFSQALRRLRRSIAPCSIPCSRQGRVPAPHPVSAPPWLAVPLACPHPLPPVPPSSRPGTGTLARRFTGTSALCLYFGAALVGSSSHQRLRAARCMEKAGCGVRVGAAWRWRGVAWVVRSGAAGCRGA